MLDFCRHQKCENRITIVKTFLRKNTKFFAIQNLNAIVFPTDELWLICDYAELTISIILLLLDIFGSTFYFYN